MKKALIKNEEAQAGVGTLIIFIAMVLVAAVAAAVLIQTSGVMQSKSTTTTKEAAAAIGENIVVEAVDGYRTSTSATNLTTLNVTLKVAAGGSDIDLSKVLVKINAQSYNFTSNSGSPPSNTFLVYVLRKTSDTSTALGSQTGNYTDSSTPALGAGALARLDVNVSSLSLQQRASITLALTPEKGSTFNLPLTLPAFSGTSIAVYP